MFTLMGVSLLVGAVLGLRYKVFVLIPAMSVGLIAAVATGVADGLNGWSIFFAVVLVSLGLQLGYLGGAASHLIFGWVSSAQPHHIPSSPRRRLDAGIPPLY